MTNFAQAQSPKNEPVKEYLLNSPETSVLKNKLKELSGQSIDIPVVVDGKEFRTGKTETIVCPHDHRKVLGVFHKADSELVRQAIQGALRAWESWSRMSSRDRASIFLRAADLLADKWRPTLNAATMLGQSKTCHQAEIDSACELIDFFRFNSFFQEQLQSVQPNSTAAQKNSLEYRALEGFVFAVTPFNFTSIAGNLPTAPALLGNVALWKPASTAVYSGYFILKLLEEAGLPPGVIQFLPGSGAQIGDIVLKDRSLAGIHFTGSTSVFQTMWKTVGQNIAMYRNYPRLVGETGGKDFVFVHESADIPALTAGLIRGAFEYQGQKCSAASRAYVPKSVWKKLREPLVDEIKTIQVGDITDWKNFMGAVIDKASFQNIRGYIEEAKKSSQVEVIAGGATSDEVGYFVQPTVLLSQDPKSRTMCEEIFGPVLTVYVYDDMASALKACDETSPYALTGAVFGQDKKAVSEISQRLIHAAGNFYINNKPTGAVVGQQPFGGARASGTNDKAGSLFNLIRWTSARTISETLELQRDYRYSWLS